MPRQLKLAMPDPSDNSRVHDLAAYQMRKAIGDAHEKRVADELKQRGWEVNEWGQGILTPYVRSALVATGSSLRWTPDFIVACDDKVALVDAKGGMASSRRDRYTVEHAAVEAHLKSFAYFDIQVFYVFGDFGVMTPMEVKLRGKILDGSPRGSGKKYWSVPRNASMLMDHVFARSGSAVGLRAVA